LPEIDIEGRFALEGNRSRLQAGQALVEFAVMLPLLLLLVMGIIQCGIVFNNWLILTDAVRSGARQLAVSRAPGQNACTLADNKVRQGASTLNTGSIAITHTVTSGCTSLTAGSDATLAATYPCDLTILGIDFAPSCTLTATMTERVE